MEKEGNVSEPERKELCCVHRRGVVMLGASGGRHHEEVQGLLNIRSVGMPTSKCSHPPISTIWYL
jgi:hypothetical protein